MEFEIIKNFNKQAVTSGKHSKKLGRSCFLFLNKNKKYILKCQPESTGVIHSLVRFIFGGSLPFQNELRIQKNLDEFQKIHFNTPKIIHVSQGKYYVSEFISQSAVLDIESISRELKSKISFALFDIKRMKKPQGFCFFKNFAFRTLESIRKKVVTDAINAKNEFEVSLFRVLRLLIKLEFKRIFLYKKIPASLIHNDMGINNILLDTDDSIYIIDWEDALWEKSWPLVDITDFSLKITTGDFDPHLLIEYFREIKNKYPGVSDNNLNNHITFGYLRGLLRFLNMKRINKRDKAFLSKRLKNFLADPRSYNKKFNELLICTQK